MDTCSRYDTAMLESGPPSVFVRTHEQLWRVEPDITRDCWERLSGRDFTRDPRHALVRDRATGFVSWWYLTSPALLDEHPRLDARFFESAEAAEQALVALGRPPIAPPSWLDAPQP